MAKKAELKTKVNDVSVEGFLNSVTDEQKREDCFEILKLMKQATKETPKMWGSSIVGFGDYHYVGKSGREGDWFLAGFSPRKQALTLYMLGGWEQHDELLAKLGRHSLGKGCLYIKRLEDVNMSILNKLIVEEVKRAKNKPKRMQGCRQNRINSGAGLRPAPAVYFGSRTRVPSAFCVSVCWSHNIG